MLSSDRCTNCDRVECPAFVKKHDEDTPEGFIEASLALADCQRHAVDWRERARAFDQIFEEILPYDQVAVVLTRVEEGCEAEVSRHSSIDRLIVGIEVASSPGAALAALVKKLEKAPFNEDRR